jgi:hypothetical protein
MNKQELAEQIKQELVTYFGDHVQAEMAYSICFNRKGVEAMDAPAKEGGRKVSDFSEQELAEFIYEQGFSGSPEYWECPVVKITDFEDNTLYFEIEQKQKPSTGNLITQSSGLITLDDNPRLFIEKYGTYFFTLKNINKLLALGFYLPVFQLATAKEAISVPAQQPSLEEKKEDLVVSDNNSSTVPCVTPLYDNNSNHQ